jgi:hypothetical protein
MRIVPTLLAAGAGSMLFAGAVAAQSLPPHFVTVQLPDGSTEQIQYAGTVAPQIIFLPASPFAQMEQLSFELNREADAILNEIPIPMPVMTVPDQLVQVDAGYLPPGTRAYEFVVNLTPRSVCTRSVEITSSGRPGAKPYVVTQSSGSCRPATNAAVPGAEGVPLATPSAHPANHLLQAKLDRAPAPASFADDFASQNAG